MPYQTISYLSLKLVLLFNNQLPRLDVTDIMLPIIRYISNCESKVKGRERFAGMSYFWKA